MSKQSPQSTPYTPVLSDFSARIKNVYIELKNYQFFHSPYSSDVPIADGKKDGRFIGRITAKNKIKEILKNSKTRSGAYLIAGFRGMGKTSVVRMAIEEYNHELHLQNKVAGRRMRNGWWWRTARSFFLYWLPFLLATYLIADLTVIDGLIPEIDFSFLQRTGQPERIDWSQIGILEVILLLVAALFLVLVLVFVTDVLAHILQRNIRWFRTDDERQEDRYRQFEINLSQEEVREIDILRRITNELDQYWQSLNISRFEWLTIPVYAPVISLLTFFLRPKSTLIQRRDYTDIRKRISHLSQRLVAQVTAESKLGLSPNFSIGTTLGLGRLNTPMGGFSKNERVEYPIANTKEVEDELIRIFREIDNLRKRHPHLIPKFIFVIDELDKIEPYRNPTIDDRESSDPAFDESNTLSGTRHSRHRQEAVASLLANLKGFLNVVRAKFFFIGGRELYDASLADIADRDSFYSSIFNQVIYINSFFKDKTGSRAGVTQMAEHYICKLILSDLEEDLLYTDQGPFDLKRVYQRLQFAVDTDGDKILHLQSQDPQVPTEPAEDQYVQTLMKSKIIFLLQSYLIYMTYRSNGTPKKIAALTENIIRKVSYDTLKQLKRDDLVVLQADRTPGSDGIFLGFKFDFQYEVGLTANIFRPYLIINSRHLKTMGDKLLFSSAFIFDHIFKFHPFGFSWRNLELIPEVILVNKEPNLRAYIEELMRFLSRTHIRDTVSGIYQYRFYNKVKTELMYLSKISDLSAAAFNFTLDESLQIKRHYKRRLTELTKKYQDYEVIDGDNNYIHAIGFIQGILGDLHFYDKEYDEALVYYIESIEPLRLPDIKGGVPITRHQFFNWLRNKLKAALTLEKMRGYNAAISIYATLCKDIPYFLDQIVFPPDVIHNKNSYRNIQMLSMPYVAYLAAVEKEQNDGITYLLLTEKERELRQTIGLDLDDKPFGYYERVIRGRGQRDYFRKFLLLADYYNNVGSILFYKNCQFPMLFRPEYKNLHALPTYLSEMLSNIYDKRKEKKIDERQDMESTYDYYPSLAAFLYYLQAARYLSEYHRSRLAVVAEQHQIKLEKDDTIALLPLYLLPEALDFINSARFYYLANVLSKLGDTVLGSLSAAARYEPIELDPFFALIDVSGANVLRQGVEDLVYSFSRHGRGESPFTLNLVFDLYRLAAAFYLKSGREQSYGYQYRKMLYVIKDVLGSRINYGLRNKIQPYGPDFEKKLRKIGEQLFYVTTWTSEVSTRPQILKYRDIFNIKDPNVHRSILYNNINNTQENREVILLIERIIQLSRELTGASRRHKIDLFTNHFISPFTTINHRYIRILELEYRAGQYRHLVIHKLNGKILFNRRTSREMIEDKLASLDISQHLEGYSENLIEDDQATFHFKKTIADPQRQKRQRESFQLIKFCIKEAIFCLRELIRSVHIYGLGNFISYSYLSYAHENLGIWSQAYRHFHHIDPTLDKEMENVIGNDALAYLEPNFHYEEAIQLYHKAIQLHREGRAYKSNILNVYMLEDDYNDNLRHFVLAVERFRVNSGLLRNRIMSLKERVARSNIYKYDSYFPIGEEE